VARLGLTLTLIVVVCAACGGSAGATAACSAPAGAKTLAHDARVVVYSASGTVFACSHASGRVTKLGNSRNCIRSTLVGPVAAAGDLIAYGAESCGVDTGSSVVIVRRPSDGRVIRRLTAITQLLGPESEDRVGSIVLRPSGAVAWIASGGSIVRGPSGGTAEVDANRSGKTSRLDSGASIKGSSLRLSGSRLSWKHGSAVRTATL
jgi:hypothetical protein